MSPPCDHEWAGRRSCLKCGEMEPETARLRQALTWIAGHQDRGKDRVPHIRCDERSLPKRCRNEATTLIYTKGLECRSLVCDRCAQSYSDDGKEPINLKKTMHLRVILAQIAEDAAEAIAADPPAR